MADHVAVVTGGGRGIGAAIARRLGADGLAVVIADPGAADRAAVRVPGAGARPTRAAAAATLATPGLGEGSLMAEAAWSLQLADSRGQVGPAAALGPEGGRLAPLPARPGADSSDRWAR